MPGGRWLLGELIKSGQISEISSVVELCSQILVISKYTLRSHCRYLNNWRRPFFLSFFFKNHFFFQQTFYFSLPENLNSLVGLLLEDKIIIQKVTIIIDKKLLVKRMIVDALHIFLHLLHYDV